MVNTPNLEEAMRQYPGDQWKNLYEETLRDIYESGHTPDDVSWVGSRDGFYAISWKEYRLAADITYYSGFGGINIPRDLVVVFKNGSWLKRDEYDGEEWWKYILPPKRTLSHQKFTLTISKNTSTIGPRYKITPQRDTTKPFTRAIIHKTASARKENKQ